MVTIQPIENPLLSRPISRPETKPVETEPQERQKILTDQEQYQLAVVNQKEKQMDQYMASMEYTEEQETQEKRVDLQDIQDYRMRQAIGSYLQQGI
jgi:hypothetical protein